MEEIYRFGEVTILPDERRVLIKGRPVKLGSRAFDLLVVLVENRHRVVTKDELLERVWGDDIVEEGNIQVHISNLRAAIGRESISTIPGRGYRLALSQTSETAELAGAEPDYWKFNWSALESRALVGREDDLCRLRDLVASGPLVTVTGAGGIGKTALARALIHGRLLPSTLTVAWIDVVGGITASGLWAAIARATGVAVHSDTDGRLIAQALQGSTALLVLDNCEVETATCAEIAATVLEFARPVRVLATSQEPLRLSGERVLRLSPLEMPVGPDPVTSTKGYPALQLFEATLAAHDSRYRIAPDDLSRIGTLCRRLEGNPLAIEMAAACVPVLGIAELMRRIDEQLDLLRGRRRDLPERQRSLRAVAEWSVGLLSERSADLLRALSVFKDDFGLEGATAVGAFGAADRFDVLESLQDLVERSLVYADKGGRPRYRLLESVRGLVREQAQQHGHWDDSMDRKRSHYATVALRGLEEFWTLPEDEWLETYRSDYVDLLDAFDGACDQKSSDIAAPIGLLLCRLDDTMGVFWDVRARKEALWPLLQDADPEAASRIWRVLGWHSVVRVAGLSETEVAEAAVDAARKTQDTRSLYGASCRLAMEAAFAGDAPRAEQALGQAQALESETWPPRLRFVGALAVMQCGRFSSDPGSALRHGERALELARQSKSQPLVTRCMTTIADAAFDVGDFDRAIQTWLAVLPDLRRQGRPAILGATLSDLARATLVLGRYDEARDFGSEALPLVWQHPWFSSLVNCFALLAAHRRQHDVAAHLIGYARQHGRPPPARPETGEVKIIELVHTLMSAELDPALVKRLVDEGARLSATEARGLCESVVLN